jgi:hypothetical protein
MRLLHTKAAWGLAVLYLILSPGLFGGWLMWRRAEILKSIARSENATEK